MGPGKGCRQTGQLNAAVKAPLPHPSSCPCSRGWWADPLSSPGVQPPACPRMSLQEASPAAPPCAGHWLHTRPCRGQLSQFGYKHTTNRTVPIRGDLQAGRACPAPRGCWPPSCHSVAPRGCLARFIIRVHGSLPSVAPADPSVCHESSPLFLAGLPGPFHGPRCCK